MSVQAITHVLDNVTGLAPAERLVLLSIANHADNAGQNAWPSKATIGREAGLSGDTVDRAVGRLAAWGFITVTVQGGGDHRVPAHRRPNRYDMDLAVIEPPAGSRRHGGLRVHTGGHLAPPSQDAPPLQPAANGGGILPPNGGGKLPPQTVLKPSLNHPRAAAERVAPFVDNGGVGEHVIDLLVAREIDRTDTTRVESSRAYTAAIRRRLEAELGARVSAYVDRHPRWTVAQLADALADPAHATARRCADELDHARSRGAATALAGEPRDDLYDHLTGDALRVALAAYADARLAQGTEGAA